MLHFFVLGVVVFGLAQWFDRDPAPADDPRLVEVSSEEIDWFRTMWRKRMQREPTVAELRGHVAEVVREEILSREARAMGLDDGDVVVRRRLAQKVDGFLQSLPGADEATDEALETFLRDNRSRYEVPGQASFVHVYFSTDRRGDDGALAAAEELRQTLANAGGAPTDVTALGDPFLLPARFADAPLPRVEREFGPSFADVVRGQALGTWSPPVRSAYGVHLVHVADRAGSRLPALAEVRDRVTADWLDAQQRAQARDAYDALRQRYRVFVEGMPYDVDVAE